MKHPLLTPEQMRQVDKLTIASGISGSVLMENAGYAVLDVLLHHYPGLKRAVILCGPGNNGGDGYVVARLLALRGVEVALYRAAPPHAGTDAVLAQSAWTGIPKALDLLTLEDGDVVIDALYGAGFRGALHGADARAAQHVLASGVPVISVDLPSGINGLTGQHQGSCFAATHTVTFFCKKSGHLLFPARAMCGELRVANIGIPSRVLSKIRPSLWQNSVDIFADCLPHAASDTHKYARGAVGVFCGGAGTTGAARLAALAAVKTGAGAVMILAPKDAVPELAAHLTSAMIGIIGNDADLSDRIDDEKYDTFVIGPGFREMPRLRTTVLALVLSRRALNLVLDADVFSAFAADPQTLFGAIQNSTCNVVMTPHDGEFQRLFADIVRNSDAKHEKAIAAAKLAGCTLIYKGPDSVIAAPDGRAVINANGSSILATAGSGDVLAGVLAGLLAQGMPAFEAACAAVYIHAEAGQRFGHGLIAEDLARAIRLPTNL